MLTTCECVLSIAAPRFDVPKFGKANADFTVASVSLAVKSANTPPDEIKCGTCQGVWAICASTSEPSDCNRASFLCCPKASMTIRTQASRSLSPCSWDLCGRISTCSRNATRKPKHASQNRDIPALPDCASSASSNKRTPPASCTACAPVAAPTTFASADATGRSRAWSLAAAESCECAQEHACTSSSTSHALLALLAHVVTNQHAAVNAKPVLKPSTQMQSMHAL